VLSGAHDVADARLHRMVAGLTRRGLSVEVLALGKADDAPAGLAGLDTHRRGGLRKRLSDAVRMPWRARGDVLLVLAPDMVATAMLFCLLRGRRLAVDLYEDYVKVVHDRPLGRGQRVAATMFMRLAVRLAARAAITSVADDHVPPRQARHRLVVRNYPDPQMLPAPSPREPDPRAVYIGDVRRTRGLHMMLAALELAPEWSLDVVGPVSPADRAWLDGWLVRSDAAHRVRFHGRQPPAVAWQKAVGAHVGLSLLADTPAFRDAVPSKLYEYFAVGLPVLATPLPRVARILAQSGGGVTVSTPAEAAEVLRQWAETPEELKRYADGGTEWVGRVLARSAPYDDLASAISQLVAA
jgi:glycosyltransferase involved in cell wall biosynthesis